MTSCPTPLLDMCVGVPLRVWQTFPSQGISSYTSDTVSGYGCARSSSSDPLHKYCQLTGCSGVHAIEGLQVHCLVIPSFCFLKQES